MISRHLVKSCCGGKSYIFDLDKPIKQSHLESFHKAGYKTPAHFVKAGLFYVQIKGLTATSSFGTRKLQVKSSGKDAETLLDNFEKLLNELIDDGPTSTG